MMKSKIVQAVGMVMLAIGLLAFLLSLQLDLIAAIVAAPLAGVFLIAGFYVSRAARQLAAQAALEALEQDPRAPVLYLRTFESESQTSKGLPGSLPLLDEGIVTEEEQLAKVVSEIGPFIAIGRPGERLPTLGAVRLYAGNEEWRGQVIELLAIAALVIIRVGGTENLLWEVRQALQHTPPDRLILLAPKLENEYRKFCEIASRIFPSGLPDYPATQKGPLAEGSVRGLIRFDEKWRPSFEELQSPPIMHARHQMLIPVYKYALKPVFERLDVPWRPPALNWYLIAVIVFFLALFGFIALQITLDSGWSRPGIF